MCLIIFMYFGKHASIYASIYAIIYASIYASIYVNIYDSSQKLRDNAMSEERMCSWETLNYHRLKRLTGHVHCKYCVLLKALVHKAMSYCCLVFLLEYSINIQKTVMCLIEYSINIVMFSIEQSIKTILRM